MSLTNYTCPKCDKHYADNRLCEICAEKGVHVRAAVNLVNESDIKEGEERTYETLKKNQGLMAAEKYWQRRKLT